MGTQQAVSRRCVFDTNVVVSAILFRTGRLSALRALWPSSTIPLVSADTVRELAEVLHYRKFKLSADSVSDALALYLPHAETVEVVKPCPLRCRDARDQKFLDLAHSAKAALLVTGDSDLLALAGKAKFRILTPSEFLAG
ncbi:MAG: putative toxin-antitoxin system toxin component, PIN family [Panacagrimonas sp.]